MKTFSQFLITEEMNYYFSNNKDIFNNLSMDNLNSFMNSLKSTVDELKKIKDEQHLIIDKLEAGVELSEFENLLSKHSQGTYTKKYKSVMDKFYKSDKLKLFDYDSSGVMNDNYRANFGTNYRRDYTKWKLFFAKCYEKNIPKQDIIKLKERICDIYDAYYLRILGNFPYRKDYTYSINYKNENYNLNKGDSFDAILNDKQFYTGNGNGNSNVYVSYTNNKTWEFLYSAIVGKFAGVNLRMVWICSVDVQTGKITQMKKMIGTDEYSIDFAYKTACHIAHMKPEKYVKFYKPDKASLIYPSADPKTGKPVDYDWAGRHPNDKNYDYDEWGVAPGTPYHNKGPYFAN